VSGPILASLIAVIKKEVRQTIRDRRVMFLLLAVPVIQLVIFGNAVDLDVDRVPTVVVDLDDTSTSRELVRRMLADGTLALAERAVSTADAERALIDGSANAAVIVPAGLSRAIARGVPAEPATVQVLIDGTNPNRSGVAASASARFLQSASRESMEARVARMGLAAPRLPRPPTLEARVLYNPRLETAVYMVPGIAAMLLLIVTTIVTAMGLARERESGTLEQVLVTPVRPWVLIAGKMLPFAAIGLFDFALAMAVGAYAFEMPIRGSFALLMLATSLYLVATLAAGLLVSTVSRTQQQAFMGGFLFMLPAALLSGIMTPIHAMPDWLRPLTLMNPLRHYAEAMRAVLLRGAGVAEVLPQLVALAVIGAVLATTAATRFRKTLS
jgi:ABC-2 type transport system permease protein